jgi:hypothetical protein
MIIIMTIVYTGAIDAVLASFKKASIDIEDTIYNTHDFVATIRVKQ